MEEKRQWVCHISGQGEKWKLTDSSDNLCASYSVWRVFPKAEGNFHPVLPKSEYVLCDPPEVWRDVTEECELVRAGYTGEWYTLVHRHANSVQEIIIGSPNHIVSGYRLRKVQLETPHKCGKTLASIVWAFIIEQKVTG